MDGRILVLGGTGLLGRPVALRLRADGRSVRVLSRDPRRARDALGPGIEVVPGDATVPEVLLGAVDGCRAVHVSVSGPADRAATERLARMALEAGVERISYVSGSTVCEANAWFPMIRDKVEAEAAVRDSGVAWTVFRPTWPFETLARFVRGGRATVIGRHPTPYHWFAAADLGRMVSTSLGLEEAVGRTLWIHGPQAITMHDAMERYRAAVHPEIPAIASMPIWAARIVGTVTRSDMLRFAAALMAYFDRVGEPGDPSEADRILGAPSTTLDDWLKLQRAA